MIKGQRENLLWMISTKNSANGQPVWTIALKVTSNSIELLHLKSIHPLWKIFRKRTTTCTSKVSLSIFKASAFCVNFGCLVHDRSSQRKQIIIWLRNAKWAYLLGNHRPVFRCFLCLSHGVCGIQMESHNWTIPWFII